MVQLTGRIRYNGENLSQFYPQRTAVYVDQVGCVGPPLPCMSAWLHCTACPLTVPVTFTSRDKLSPPPHLLPAVQTLPSAVQQFELGAAIKPAA